MELTIFILILIVAALVLFIFLLLIIVFRTRKDESDLYSEDVVYPEYRIMLDQNDFESLVSGKIIEKGPLKIALQDIGYNVMHTIENNKTCGNFNEGSVIKRTKLPGGNGCQIGLYTVGKEYKILKIKDNYRTIKKAVALRSDDGKLRWLSFDRVVNEHELIL